MRRAVRGGPPGPGPLTGYQRGQAEGSEMAVVLFVVVGVVLIMTSVAKRFRSGGDKGVKKRHGSG